MLIIICKPSIQVIITIINFIDLLCLFDFIIYIQYIKSI